MRTRRPVVELALTAASVVLFAGCLSTSDEFPDDTARVELSDRTYELEVASCGQDDDEDVFVLVAESADSLLQLLLTVDGDQVDTEASAISFEARDTSVLGAGDHTLLQAEPGAPGVIDVASIEGDRIDVEADVGPIDPGGTGAGGGRLDLVARCAGVGEAAFGDAARRTGRPTPK
ncbi:MAG: hypothetical protein U5K30_13810 [Acidimicrobiales bacterium]|nr:hypothetical protein [Acidimicrobiales bacterium]